MSDNMWSGEMVATGSRRETPSRRVLRPSDRYPRYDRVYSLIISDLCHEESIIEVQLPFRGGVCDACKYRKE